MRLIQRPLASDKTTALSPEAHLLQRKGRFLVLAFPKKIGFLYDKDGFCLLCLSGGGAAARNSRCSIRAVGIVAAAVSGIGALLGGTAAR